jgi:hypothetical protein
VAADAALDAASSAILRFLERMRSGHADELHNAAGYLRRIAFRAAFRFLKHAPHCVPIDLVTLLRSPATYSGSGYAEDRWFSEPSSCVAEHPAH